jgi:hypothetical protein
MPQTAIVEDTTPEELDLDQMLIQLKDNVKEYLDGTVEARYESEKARDYYDGRQWTDDEARAKKNRREPVITINRVKPKVQFLKGMETQNRTDPKALPREPSDDESGEVSTDALRYVEERNNSDKKFSAGFQNYLVEGTEIHEVIITKKGGKEYVEHNRIMWDRFFLDVHSRELDASDNNWHGTLDWMDVAEARIEYPEAPDEFFSFDELSDSDTFEDKPYYFIDKKRKRIRVFFEYFKHKGEWWYAVFSGGGFAITPRVSTYLDEYQEPESQFVIESAFIDRLGRRYGEVASYLDPQDEINHRRSKGLHFVSSRQTWGNQGAVADVSKLKKEAQKADGHLEFSVGEFNKDFGFVNTNDMAQGQLAFLQEAKGEIDQQGANSVMQGQIPAPLSGKAVQSLQQGGVVDLGSLFDGHGNCKLNVYRKMFNRIKQTWTEPKWIRVLGDDSKIKFTGLNREITARDKFIEEVGQEEFDQLPPYVQNDPRLDTVVGIENPVNELDVDIILDQAGDTLTLQHEQFELLSKMYQANPNAVPFEVVIKASQLRNKDELIKMIEGGDDEQKAAMFKARQQQEDEQRQLAKAAAAAKIELDKSTAEKNDATTQKTKAETKQVIVETVTDIHEATKSDEAVM